MALHSSSLKLISLITEPTQALPENFLQAETLAKKRHRTKQGIKKESFGLWKENFARHLSLMKNLNARFPYTKGYLPTDRPTHRAMCVARKKMARSQVFTPTKENETNFLHFRKRPLLEVFNSTNKSRQQCTRPNGTGDKKA